MTIVITENLQGTRAGSIDAAGARTLQRQFTIIGTNILQDAIEEMDTQVPPLTSTYVVGTDPQSGVAVFATYYGTKSWTRLEGSDDVWSFTLTYSTAPSAGGGGYAGEALITTQGDTRATTKAVYRVDPQGDVDSPTGADIGGDPIDEGGTPTSITTIDRRFSTTEKSNIFPRLDNLSELVGKRNASEYEGGEKGSILYLGFSWSYDTSSGLWAISHQFAVDKKTHHAEQVAKTDPDGEVIKNQATKDGATILTAAHVFWVQPFALVPFNDLPDF